MFIEIQQAGRLVLHNTDEIWHIVAEGRGEKEHCLIYPREPNNGTIVTRESYGSIKEKLREAGVLK